MFLNINYFSVEKKQRLKYKNNLKKKKRRKRRSVNVGGRFIAYGQFSRVETLEKDEKEHPNPPKPKKKRFLKLETRRDDSNDHFDVTLHYPSLITILY